MAINIPSRLIQLTTNGVVRYATCWKLERTDGIIQRYTDHDKVLVFEGENYEPMGMFNASARQKIANLKDRNLELKGYLDDARITFDDLRDGKYDDAKVTEYLVDWQFPFAGAISKNVYWLTNIQYDGEVWTANVAGVTRKLTASIGRVYSRICDALLGDTRCGVDLDEFEQTGTVSLVLRDRVVVHTDLSMEDGWWKYGSLTWTSGNNNGTKIEIKESLMLNGRLDFVMRTRRPIQVGDTFTIIPGCDGLGSTCEEKFNNKLRFRGFDTIPGTDAMFTTPDS